MRKILRALFERATARWQGTEGRDAKDLPGGFGDIVMVPSVREARQRGVLKALEPFERFTETGVQWADGTSRALDAVIWCTGFRPALHPLAFLGVVQDTRRVSRWNSGYSDAWTLVGWVWGMDRRGICNIDCVMRTARSTAAEIDSYLSS
ncbi:hypothetical protein OURE66S_04567 [Oligella ureolytica]